MLENELKDPQRQAWPGVAVMYVKNLRIGFNVFLAMIVPLMAGWQAGSRAYIYIAAAVALIAVGVLAWFQYQNFYFQVVDDKFIIHKGVFKKEELSVPFGRIQSVHIKQNIVQQILQVVALEIDTAGSVQKEVGIPALTRSYAEALKTYLLRQKNEQLSTEETIPKNETDNNVELSDKPILRLGILDLLKVGITENHLRTGLIAFGVMVGYFNQLEEFLADDVAEATKQVEAYINSLAFIIPLAVLTFVVLSVLLSLIRTVLRFFNLTVYLDNRGLTMQAGLLKRQENLIPKNKIQYINWQSNPLRKLIGYASLTIYQASSGAAARKHAVSVPGCQSAQIEEVNHSFFPELALNNVAALKPDRFWQWRLTVLLALPPVALLVLLAIFENVWIAAGIPVVAAVVWYFVMRYVQNFSATLNSEMLQLNRGWVFPQTILLKLYKVQTVTVAQSIFQKRRGLVSLHLSTAGGNITIPYVPQDAGTALADYLLYKIETSRVEWM